MASRKVFTKKPVANADQYIPTPVAVETVELNEGAELLKRTQTDEIWRGTVQVDALTDAPVYFRMSAPRGIISELICSVLGRALGLPIPRPYLIRIKRKTLESSQRWASGESERYTFGCAEVSSSTAFSQLVAQDSDYAKKLLRKWDLYPHTVTFDEWVANLDRNQSNILFSANIIWLIDHADALGGVLAELHPLSEIKGDQFANVLIDRHVSDFSIRDKSELLEIAAEVMAYAKSINLGDALSCASIHSLISPEAVAQVLDFLASRVPNTIPLLSARVGLNQLDFSHE
ncbi:HipA family kinase [Paraburkholderia tropica]|uniref:HipA family kinase n=1 Tax=Paraburkholderia tropica TaxID=92647 RepID=UPI00160A7704|nr:HipA family kinase [Paraburkholderia tropica]MBB6320551.1 hypothetical protein [Paraburkholderia tropica]